MEPQEKESMLARPLAEQLLAPQEYLADAPFEDWAMAGHRFRLIAALAIERGQWDRYHAIYRSTSDESLKILASQIARVEDRHVAAMQSLLPASARAIERAIWHEQALMYWFVRFGQEEQDSNLRAALEYILADTVEHLRQMATVAASGGLSAAEVMGDAQFQFRAGRPMADQHLAEFDAIKRPIEIRAAHAETLARSLISEALVFLAHQNYHSLLSREVVSGSRQVFALIELIKEGHLDLLGSLWDASATVAEQALAIEYSEISFYSEWLDEEPGQGLATLIRRHLADELGHQAAWADAAARAGLDVAHLLRRPQHVDVQMVPAEGYLDSLLPVQLASKSKGKSYVEIGKVKEAYS